MDQTPGVGAPAATSPTAPTRGTAPRQGVWLLTLAAFALYGGYSLQRFRMFWTAGFDLGIFDQAVRAYSHFAAPLVALKGPSYNILGDHFHPILALAAPLYWIWDDPRTLLLLQAALLALSIPVVYRFAARRMPAGWALTLAAGYALSWPVAGVVDYDFHEIAFGVPLLGLAVDALDRSRDPAAARHADRTLLVTCAALLLVREDLGAVVLVIGLLRAWRRPRLGLALAGIGAATFLVVTNAVIPAFANSGQFAYWTFDSLGPDLPSAVAHLVGHPLDSARIFLTPAVKVQTLAFLLLPLALLPLASPYSLIAAPLLAERFFNSRDLVWSTFYHYNAPIWIVFFLAMIDAGGRLGIWTRPRVRATLASGVLAAQLLIIAVSAPVPPAWHYLLNGNAWRPDARIAAQNAALAQIPPNTCVAADDRIAVHLTKSNRVTLPGIAGPRPDYIVLDLAEPQPGLGLRFTLVELARARAAGYQTVWAQQGVRVLRAAQPATDRPECRP